MVNTKGDLISGRETHTGQVKDAYKIAADKPEKSTRNTTGSKENNIKMNFKEILCEVVDYICSVNALKNTVNNILVP